MLSAEQLMSLEKIRLEEESKTLQKEDIAQLVDWLTLKADSIRYPAFLLLQHRSRSQDDVYPHWDAFREKLGSENSYQRSIGLMLLAANARWDAEGRLDHTIDEYLKLLGDEKPITARQCVQALAEIVPYRPDLCGKIAVALLSVNLAAVKETMRRPLLLDILNILLLIRTSYNTDEIEGYILTALSGELLNKKEKKELEARL